MNGGVFGFSKLTSTRRRRDVGQHELSRAARGSAGRGLYGNDPRAELSLHARALLPAARRDEQGLDGDARGDRDRHPGDGGGAARRDPRPRRLDLSDELIRFCGTLLDLAEREVETVMPQWTHFQHAQVSTLGHYFAGIVDALVRDLDRLRAAYRTTNRSTLGCGALAGTSYPVDRQLVADLLGFDGFQENTIDCVSSADYMLDVAAAVASLMVTLSRLSQDLWIWHTEEFGFVVIGDEYAGSSSMMPQKKNAYPFEYVRARAAHAIGDLMAAFGTLRAANFQDLKDVEEEGVTPVFRSLDEVSRSMRLLDGAIPSLEVRRDVMLEQAASGFAASTELAAAIHRRSGLSSRTAHRIVANLVLRAY